MASCIYWKIEDPENIIIPKIPINHKLRKHIRTVLLNFKNLDEVISSNILVLITIHLMMFLPFFYAPFSLKTLIRGKEVILIPLVVCIKTNVS